MNHTRSGLSRTRVRAMSGARLNVLGAGAVLAAATLAAAGASQPWVNPRLLFVDPIAAAETAGYCCAVYFGVFSHLGVLLWFGAGAVALFGALCLWTAGDSSGEGWTLAAAGALSGLLALDDLLLLHEFVLPGLGLPQTAVLAAYGVALASYLFAQRGELPTGRGVFLGLAYLCFGASVGLDVLLHALGRSAAALEDGLKFVGIAAWVVFHVRLTFDAVVQRFEDAPRLVFGRRAANG